MPYVPVPEDPDDIFNLHGKALDERVMAAVGWTPTADPRKRVWRDPNGKALELPHVSSSIDRWRYVVWPTLESSGWDVSITHSSIFGWYVSMSTSRETFTGTSTDNLPLLIAHVSLCALESFRKANG